MEKNIMLFVGCLCFNLIVGNIVLFAFLIDAPVLYHVLISLVAVLVYLLVFFRMVREERKPPKIRLAGAAVISCLLIMLGACILVSVANRLPTDSIVMAGLKGVVPLFAFAMVFGVPVWIPLAACNFFCFNGLEFKA